MMPIEHSQNLIIGCGVAGKVLALVLRTRTLSQTREFMKALIGADDRILGSPRSERKQAS
jgi:hypothetical protein